MAKSSKKTNLSEIIYVFSTPLVLLSPNQADQCSWSSLWQKGKKSLSYKSSQVIDRKFSEAKQFPKWNHDYIQSLQQ